MLKFVIVYGNVKRRDKNQRILITQFVSTVFNLGDFIYVK